MSIRYLLGADQPLSVFTKQKDYCFIKTAPFDGVNTLNKKFVYSIESGNGLGYKIINREEFNRDNPQKAIFDFFVAYLKKELMRVKEIFLVAQILSERIEDEEEYNTVHAEITINLASEKFSENEFGFRFNTLYRFVNQT